jgi:hypothetical protein
MPPTETLKRVYTIHKKWIADIGDRVSARALRNLAADLESAGVSEVALIADSLQKLGYYYGVHASVGVFEEDASADLFLDKSIAYWMWSIRMRRLGMEKSAYRHNVTNYLDIAANCLCYSMANGLSAWSEQLAGFLVGATSNADNLLKEYWDQRSFEPFVLAVHQGTWKKELKNVKFGPYGDVLTAWNDLAQFDEVILDLCDYHSNAIEDNERIRDPEFDHPPFDFVPWELLMLLRLRNDLSGSRVFQHPLLAINANRLTATGKLHDDELLQRVCAIAFQHS